MIDPTPPRMIAGTVPSHCAVKPDSNWPTWFEAPANGRLVAETSFFVSESTMAIELSREVDIVSDSFECHSLGGTVLPKEEP